MFGPRTFAVRNDVSLLDKLHSERGGNFVQLDGAIRLRPSIAYRGKTNNRSDQRYTNQFADDRFHSRKAKRLPQTRKWQQYSPQRAVAQSATGRIRGGELGRTVAAA